MKRFLKNTLLFASIFAVMAALVSSYFFFRKSQVDAQLDEIAEHECLIVGDSQMQRLDPEIFSRSTYNFSSLGEHYYFTYHKLKEVLSSEQSEVECILLGASLHNFAPVYGRLMNMKKTEGKDSFSRFLYLIPTCSGEFIELAEVTLPKLMSGVFCSPDWGGYFRSEASNPDSATINRVFKMHYERETDEALYSQSQAIYLQKIDSLCAAKSIPLFLCSTPYHPEYLRRIDPGYRNYFEAVVSSLEHAESISFLKDHPDPSIMSDANHLNVRGGKIYAQRIDSILQQKLKTK
jgi:hypothetical protein